jgi:peroxidase
VDGIRNNLFGPPGAGGLDLAALDIQRGRDHGLPDFNTLRRLYGVAPVTSFEEISSDPAIVATLRQLYPDLPQPDGTVILGFNNIDPFVGMLAEDHLTGSSIGPTINAIVGNQFERLRDGDRFFYTNDAFLHSEGVGQIIDLDKVSLKWIIKKNTDVNGLQGNVFFDKSVIFFEAPDAGANFTLVVDASTVRLTDTRTGEVLAEKNANKIAQVILVGSDSAADFFNLFIAAANRGLERGVEVYGGGSGGDVMNVYGTSGNDTFAVGPETVAVNDNVIEYSGIERIRLVKLGGDDSITIDEDVLAEVLAVLF